jgi:HSP20 family molecular chaperone IbpA
MVHFLPSNTAIIAAALVAASSLRSSDAAYGRYYIDTPHRPSLNLGSRLLPILGTPSGLVTQDPRRDMMYEMDEMLNAMLGGGRRQSRARSLDELFYEPFAFRPSSSYFLQELPLTLNALLPSTSATTTPTTALATRTTSFGITQDDETQLQIVVHLPPGTTARDVNVKLNEDNHVLSISGETKREEGGISVHSRFDRSFTLHPRDVDMSKITAQLDDNGVLTIIAPKFPKVVDEEVGKENVRRIDIVEQQQHDVKGADEMVIEDKTEKQEDIMVTAEMNVDDSVIDLDVK